MSLCIETSFKSFFDITLIVIKILSTNLSSLSDSEGMSALLRLSSDKFWISELTNPNESVTRVLCTTHF